MGNKLDLVERPQEIRVRVVFHLPNCNVRHTVDDHHDEFPDGRETLGPDEKDSSGSLIEERVSEGVAVVVV